MAAPRLPFLWPMLFKPRKPPPRIVPRKSRPNRNFSAFACRADASGPQRYGTAQEPDPHLRGEVAQDRNDGNEKPGPARSKQEPVEEEEEEELPPTPAPQLKTSNAAESLRASPPPEKPPRGPDSKPLETVLHMPSPAEEEVHKPPHLKAPPYVHHFDTYSLVKQLSKGGFTDEQAVTTMKAVRGILTENMELAREGLVSKSNVENETYLFRAACSELRTEVENSRKGATEKMRSERNQLQHELDILNQRLGQETTHLKDDLKGMFDDRKMAVRQEQRNMESKIQELNYKITVALNSDARSEVEALRWVLTRRAAITIGASAFMLFLALRYSSYVAHNQAEENKKAQDKQPHSDESHNNSSANNSPLSDQEGGGGELLTTSGGVSLG